MGFLLSFSIDKQKQQWKNAKEPPRGRKAEDPCERELGERWCVMGPRPMGLRPAFGADLLLSLPAAGWPTNGWNERNKNPLIEVDPRCQSLESQPSLTFGRYWKKTRSSQPMVGRNLDLLLSSSTSKDWLMDER